MNTPDTSGAKSLAQHIAEEVGARLFSQVSQFNDAHAGEDVAID